MDFQQCNVMMRDDIRFSAVKLEVCPDSKSESYVQWLPVLLIGIVIFYLHKMYYVHMYTHNMRSCSRFYIGRIRNVMDVHCMVSSGSR